MISLEATGGTLGLANITPLLISGLARGIGTVALSSASDLVLGPTAVVTPNQRIGSTPVSYISAETNTGTVVLTAGRNLVLQPGSLARAGLVLAESTGGVFESGKIAADRILLGGPNGTAAGLVALGSGAWLASGGAGPFAGPLPLARWPTPVTSSGTFINTVNFTLSGTPMLIGNPGQPAPLLRLDISGIGTTGSTSSLSARTGTVFINMGRLATLTAGLDAYALYVAYPRGTNGSADFSGTIRGTGGQSAAQLAFIQPSPSSAYRFNACAIASVSCVVVSTERLPQTVPTRDLDIRPARDDSDDTEVLLPNVSRRDF